MLLGTRIAVVIPAFNEAQWIADTVATVPGFVDQIIVVDDRSDDATADVALRAGDARLEVLRHTHNRGVGAAIETGYGAARQRGAEIVAVMAGDGQMHPGDLEALVLPLAAGEADYVKGDRLHHPDVWRMMPLHRLGAGFALSWLTRRAAGLDSLSDSQCGYTAISARAIDALAKRGVWPGYGYPNDVLGALAAQGFRIRDVVVRPVYRGESSGLRPWHLMTIGYLIARTAWRARLAAGALPAAVSSASWKENRSSPAGDRAFPTSR